MIELLSLFVVLAGVASPSGEVAREGDPRAGSRTAVAVTLENGQLPEIEAMQGWFVAGEEPLKVVAVERGPAEVVAVRDTAAQLHLDLLAKGFLNWALAQTLAPVYPKSRRVEEWDPLLLADGAGALVRDGKEYFWTTGGRPMEGDLEAMRRELRRAFSLGDDVRLRFVSPLAAPVSRTVEPMNVFNLSPSFPARNKGFLTFVEAAPALAFGHRFSDAVALAGHVVHATGHRRAVVVLIEGSSPDDSLYSGAGVAELLAGLQVPVFVWSFGRGAFSSRWSGERLITETPRIVDTALDLVRFEVACDELRATLEAQRVVWLEGIHPPTLVRLTEAAAGIRLAGEVPELTEVPPKVRAVLLQRRRARR